MRMCVTGHRPGKMPTHYGYDITNENWTELKERLKKLLIDKQCAEAITGMALGVDTVFALAVIELKESGYNIKLHSAIPCRNQEKNWSIEDQLLYGYILSKADTIKLVSDKEYKAYLMQIRNEYMVDNSDEVIAVWNGEKKGGTYNCIKYAELNEKPINFLVV